MNFLISLLFISSTYAQTISTALPADAVGLSSLESVEVVSVRYDVMMCPMVMGTECRSSLITAVTVKYTLQGCVDEISPVTYEIQEGNDDRRRIFLSAHNIHTIESNYNSCFVPSTREIHIALEGHIPAEKITVETMRKADDVEEVKTLTPGEHVELLIANNARLISTENFVGLVDHTQINMTLPYSCGNVVSHVNVRTAPLPNNKMLIFVSAVEANLKSTAGRCKMRPSKEFSVHVPGTYNAEDVQIINLDKTANLGLPY